MSALMDLPLPGLERLMDVCRRHGIPMEVEPPGHSPPQAEDPVAGLPFDPVLASIYARFGRLAFGGDLYGFHLYRLDEQANHLVEANEERRQRWPESFRSALFIFAYEPALTYSLATVPGLADARGRQPVVRVDPYEDLYALPIASDVDHFFETWSRSLERQVEFVRAEARFREELGPGAPDSALAASLARIPRINFPWEVPDLIARDRPLLELLRAGRFDFLMEACEDARKWVGAVLAAGA